jgi:4-hydroxybenzoate polyprenyltransferase
VNRAPDRALATPTPPPMRSRMSWRAITREVRPKQWIKNGLVFFALVYALQIGNLPLLLRACLGFLAFCAISSAGYLINDLRDADLDRLHPTKRYRPIASGQISSQLAASLAAALAVLGFALAMAVGTPFVAVCIAYVLITVSYSLWWKHVVLLDVFAISAGFVVRIVAGAIAVNVPVSPWLYVCTILGSLLIAFGKRRSEIIEMDQEAEAHRPALEHYTIPFLDHLIVITATASVMAYSLYTFSAENVPRNHAMMATIPLVLYGVFRYLYLTMVKGSGGSPEELLLSDRSLAVSVALFLLMSAGILYLAPYWT